MIENIDLDEIATRVSNAFVELITSVASVAASPVGTAAVSFIGAEVMVSLTDVADNPRVTISLIAVNGTLVKYTENDINAYIDAHRPRKARR